MIKGIKYSVLASSLLLAAGAFHPVMAEEDAKVEKQEQVASSVNFGSMEKNASYALGFSFAQKMRDFFDQSRNDYKIDLDESILMQGFTDAFAGKSQMSDTDLKNSLKEFDTVMRKKHEDLQKAEMEKMEQLKQENLKKGREFLENNAKQPGVKVTASGLQYKVNKEGTGAKVSSRSDLVSVIYTGKLIDGKVFDSNKDKDPIEFPLEQVIPGWQEGLELMSVGAEYTLYIPAELAYRDQIMPGNVIPPNSTLIFDVKLVDVKSGGASEDKGEPKQE